MEDKLKLLARSFGENKVKFNEELKYHLASKTGGIAKLFAVVVNERELIRIIGFAQNLSLKFIVIGTGSKVDLSDGFEGVVIRNRAQTIKIISIKGKIGKGNLGVESVLLEAEGGVAIADLIIFLKKQGLKTDELIDMRGSIGGNIFISRSLRDLSDRVRILNLDGEIEIIKVEDLDLRSQVVLSVVLKIKSV